MKEIKVGKNHVALIDDRDWPLVSKNRWSAYRNDHLVYAVTRKDGKVIKMERLITGDFDSYCIDHKDGNSLNNQRSNLRPANRYENASNRKDHKIPCELGFGVRSRGKCGGFNVNVCIFGRHLNIVGFESQESAQRAYDALKFLAVGAFGEFNHPLSIPTSIMTLKEYMKTARQKYVDEIVKRLGSKREAARALGISEATIYRGNDKPVFPAHF